MYGCVFWIVVKQGGNNQNIDQITKLNKSNTYVTLCHNSYIVLSIF